MSFNKEALRVVLFKYSTNSALDVIEQSYQESVGNQCKYKKDIESRWNKFQNEINLNSISQEELEELTSNGYDYGEHLTEMYSEIESAIKILREAFVITIHHLWERQVNRLMHRTHYDEGLAFEFLKTNGFAVDEENLKILRLTANVAKHDRGRSADELFALNSSSFDVAKISSVCVPGYNNLVINDNMVEQFFVTIRNSVQRN